MNNIQNTNNAIKRYSIIILLLILFFLLYNPAGSELKTFALIVASECLAIILSSLAVFSFTKLDFINTDNSIVLAYLFLGVHICTGLTILGVYLAQF